jgi:hypothetical protein
VTVRKRYCATLERGIFNGCAGSAPDIPFSRNFWLDCWGWPFKILPTLGCLFPLNLPSVAFSAGLKRVCRISQEANTSPTISRPPLFRDHQKELVVRILVLSREAILTSDLAEVDVTSLFEENVDLSPYPLLSIAGTAPFHFRLR